MPQVLIKGLVIACISVGVGGFAPSSTDQTQFLSKHNHNHHQRLQTTLYSSPIVDYAAIDIAEDATREISWMERWATEYGVQRSDGFKLIEENKGKEVYATTTQDMPGGSPVLIVPESLILSSNKAIAELRGAGMEEAEKFVIGSGAESEYRHWYLMLKILKEIQNGRDSPWFHWLNSLPRYYSNAPSMTDFCLQCLPPLMRKLTGEERENQHRLSVESIKMVPFLCDDLKYHPRDFCRWAYQIVYTRSIETEDGDLRIVPMADYFNHGSDYTEVQSSYDEAGNYCAYTLYDVPAGSPLRISYADPRNPSHLLARYGFLDEECPATYCKLLPPTVNQDMIDLGYSFDRMLFYKTGEVADEVWDIFLYQHLSATNIDDQQALMRAHREEDYDTKLALHENYYSATSAALLEHVESFMKDIDKVIKKAETIGVSDPNTPYVKWEHPRLPLIHKHNLFVKEVFQNVRNRYSSNTEEVNWREATRVTVEECDDTECALAECVLDFQGNWLCEGGLGPNWDGSERQKMQTVIASE